MAWRLGDPAIQAFLATREVVVLATVALDGAPAATPMWFLPGPASLGMVSLAGTAKVRNIRRDPRVSVAAEAVLPGGGIQGVALQGRAEVLGDVPERQALVEGLLARYHPRLERLWGGRSMPANRAVIRITPMRVRAWGLDPTR